MPNRKTKPTSPGRRFATYPLREQLTASRPERKLTEGLRKSGGRNVNGRVIMYADTVTNSMRIALSETERRRKLQEAYNTEHGITPASIVKAIDDASLSIYQHDYSTPMVMEDRETYLSPDQIESRIEELQAQMRQAAVNLDFELAATIRDRIKSLKGRELGLVAVRSTRS